MSVTLLQYSQLMVTVQTVLEVSGSSVLGLYLAFMSQLGQRNCSHNYVERSAREKLKIFFSPTFQLKNKKLHTVRSPQAVRVRFIKPLVVDEGGTDIAVNE